MRILIIPVVIIGLALSFGACKTSSTASKLFCDTTCLKDTVKFTGDYKLKPYVYITARNCMADTIIWSYSGMGVNKKEAVSFFTGKEVQLNKDYIRCFFNDTAYVWVMFNNCATGHGYLTKLPFNRTASIGRKSKAINNIDPKFSITGSLVAYTDPGNIFVEDMFTGKTAQLTFGKALEIDYDNLHEYIDSVNITPSRIWVKVKIDNEWKELEKKITLK
jgi:hypothetical protein